MFLESPSTRQGWTAILILMLGSTVSGCSRSSPQAPPSESAAPTRGRPSGASPRTLLSGREAPSIALPSKPTYQVGSLPKDEPQAVYSADRDDSWNRIFYCLFTRTVQLRLSDDFLEGAPFSQPTQTLFPQRSISDGTFERIEGGDRAIEPLYPSFLTSSGPFQVLDEPRYSQLTKALVAALQENADRTPLARALMQSDVWAAHDILSREYDFAHKGEQGNQRRARKDKLLALLAKLIKRLALTSEEIKSLPDNYAAAANTHHLPDLFAQDSAWMEVRRDPARFHDGAADHRRAARVFVKPAKPPQDVPEFLEGLRDAHGSTPQLSAVALITQNLLIDNTGKVVPSPLTYEVQLRTFVKDEKTEFGNADLQQYDLSRRLLLSEAKTGGLVGSDDKSPAYLPLAYNDYGFAGRSGAGQPLLVALRTRCVGCHGERAATVVTFGPVQVPPPSPVVHLKPSDNDCARDVAQFKMESANFKALRKQWAAE